MLKKYWSLLILTVLFVIPGIAAYVVYQNPSLLASQSTNHGSFVKPPVKIIQLPGVKKWRLVYFNNGDCNEICMGSLDKLARIRLALGRRLYNVDSYLFLPKSAADINQEQQKVLDDVGIQMQKINPSKQQYHQVFSQTSGYYIISPEKYVILAYSAASSADDIYTDLKKLVND